ncbi:hypothetical protein EON80_21030 [bacterium]|nr:MAG: hypothetical protein EON80_21030 [bacterium]
MPPQSTDIPARRAIFWTLSAFFLTLAVRANGGRYAPEGMLCLSLSILSAIGGVFLPGLLPIPDSQKLLNGVLAAGSTVFAAFWLMPEGDSPRWIGFLGSWGLCIAVAVLLLKVAAIPRFKRLLFPLLMLVLAFYWVSELKSARHFELTSDRLVFHVRNDVQTFAEVAATQLSAGKNPYSVHMPNVMGADMPFYSEGTTTWTPGTSKPRQGTLTFGYPYLPLTALWSLPGHWLGDFRFTHIFALIAAAGLLAYARPSTTSQLAATFFLLFPPALFILLMSWIEPVVVFFLAATVFCYFRAPKWLFLALGCLVASKQYTFFVLVLLPLLVPEKTVRRPLMLKSIAVALVLSVPMALWDWPGFYRSVIEIQFKQPFRKDSLSYLVTVLQLGGIQLSPAFGFLALLGGLGLGVWKAPRVPALWCSAAAVAYLGFFALNKQAFANYYFWPFSLLVAAVAIALPPTQSETVPDAVGAA